MALLPRPGQDFEEVVADVSAELHVRRADMVEAPVLQRTLRHPDDVGDLRLRLEVRRCATPDAPMSMYLRCAGVVRGDPYEMPPERGDRDTNPAHGHAREYLVPHPVRRVETPRNEGRFCCGILRKLLLGYLDSNQEQLNQNQPCCQLHHTPMALNRGSRADM